MDIVQGSMSQKSAPHILLRSSWQVVNIGDIAHTPGVLTLLEQYFPEAKVTLWASQDLTEEIEAMERKRFPGLPIVKGVIDEKGNGSNKELDDAIKGCDFLLHGSGPSFVAWQDVEAFERHIGKPFGVFGITYEENAKTAEILSKARFIYFRDGVSLNNGREAGITCPIMEFGPDGAFAVDLREDAKAEAFLRSYGLEEGKFLCCIPRLRYTPYWKIKNTPFDEIKHARNEQMKEHDHAPLREAITAVVRETGMKVLVCPEDMTQMEVGKEMIMDKLPEDVRKHVVWRETYWLTDEALSVYVRSAGLFGNEMHSPIMCIGNGVPAIVCRWKEQTSKGFMWRDIGLGDWLVDMDDEKDISHLVPTVMELLRNPEAAKRKTLEAGEKVRNLQIRMVNTLKNTWR